MEENKIDEMSTDVKKFLDRESNTSLKINYIEEKLNKMQNYFTRPEIDIKNGSEEQEAFNNFIRKGIVRWPNLSRLKIRNLEIQFAS